MGKNLNHANIAARNPCTARRSRRWSLSVNRLRHVESPKGIKIDALNAYNIYIKEQYQNKNNGRHMEVNISTDKLMVVITILYPSTLAIYLKLWFLFTSLFLLLLCKANTKGQLHKNKSSQTPWPNSWRIFLYRNITCVRKCKKRFCYLTSRACASARVDLTT